MEAEIFTEENVHERKESPAIRRYKIASELRRHGGKIINPCGQSTCYTIPETQDCQMLTRNIFNVEEAERPPDIETAKEYELVGYKIVKATTQKKEKRKLARKNTESASSRHSKYSSSLPTIDRGIVLKQSLIEKLKKVEEKENNKNIEPSRLSRSRYLLQSFQKLWKRQMIKDAHILKRKASDSLLCLSDMYRSKIQKLQLLRVNQIKSNPRPDEWQRSLCDGRSFINYEKLQGHQSVGKIVDCSRGLERTLNTTLNNKTQFMAVEGRSKLKQEAMWLNKTPHKHFIVEKPRA